MHKQILFFFLAFSFFCLEPASGSADLNNPCLNESLYPLTVIDTNKDQLNIMIRKLEREIIGTFSVNKDASKKEKTENTNEIHKCDKQIQVYRNALKEIEKEEKAVEECKGVTKEMEEAYTEFAKSCASFSGGTANMKCVNAIDACDKCPSEENYGDYDCVKIHEKTQCPALSGKELEEAKEKREDIDKEIKGLKEDINEQEQDITSKEETLNDALTELETNFIEATRNLERDTEDAKAQLEKSLREGKRNIDENLSKQFAEVQASIDSSLKIAHSFENAIYKANREYRQERRKIVMECEAQTKVDLAKYRQRRRRAIETGSLSISISSWLQKGRVSFAQRDSAKFNKYNEKCLSRRKEDFKGVKDDYNQKLKLIEQQKQEYLEILSKQKKQLASFNQAALKAGNGLVQDYAKLMDKILTSYDKEYRTAMQDYNTKKGSILSQTKAINVLNGQFQKKRHTLHNKRKEFVREKELIHYLASKGVESSEKTKDQFPEAMASYQDYKSHITTADDTCNCEESEDKCKEESEESEKTCIKRNKKNKKKCKDESKKSETKCKKDRKNNRKCNAIKTANVKIEKKEDADSDYQIGGFNDNGNR